MTGRDTAPALPGLAGTVVHRVAAEFLEFRRTREAIFFTVAFPLIMLALFGTIFGRSEIGPPQASVSFSQYFVAGMIGSGIWGACFQNLAVTLALDRDSGALKRLAGTPMPPSAFFVGKIVFVLLVTLVETALLLMLGVLFYGLRLPPAGRWVTFCWVFVLGVAACTLLGLAVAGVVRRGRSASALVTPVAVILQFLSGVYFVFGDLPGWLQAIGSVFPLRWITLGMRSVFLPEPFRVAEPGHSWQAVPTVLVLATWCVLGLIVTVRTFRWTPTYQGV